MCKAIANEMTISELESKKKSLEKTLKTFIEEEIKEFVKETEVYVYSVNIQMIETTTCDNERRQFTINNVNVGLALGI